MKDLLEYLPLAGRYVIVYMVLWLIYNKIDSMSQIHPPERDDINEQEDELAESEEETRNQNNKLL